MALVKVKVEREVNAHKLLVRAEVRYWEDATVDGVEDAEGNLIPCRLEDDWRPAIEIDTGIITNWKQGVKADIHYKVCDAGFYQVNDNCGNVLLKLEGYVPDIMCPEGEGFGDYIIMHVDENGKIDKWNVKALEKLFTQQNLG